ncbi:MAG: HAD hydrolase family protein [Candidatus Eremiobacteraeota bacterium]|nr:HAD hydrolase family protein [Candidatus Eremiobacteraeota bacterium]
MRYFVLATDYDNTLADHNVVLAETRKAIDALKKSGRSLVLVTGRMLDDLLQTFEGSDVCDAIVAENGAVLYLPKTKERVALAPAPPPAFLDALRRRGVPFVAGQSIVATEQPHDVAVLEAIKELALELHIVFNKGAVMVLPTGVNKASGLAAALERLGFSAHNAAGIGDAENDHAFLHACEFAAAVANALPSLRDEADLVTSKPAGAGVAELIEAMIEDDLLRFAARLQRRTIEIGKDPASGAAVTLDPYTAGGVLVAGGSKSGKSKLALAIVERLMAKGYQLCIFDPEGDYEPPFGGALALGDPQTPPRPEQVEAVLAKPGQSLILNLLGVPLDARPQFVDEILPSMLKLRERTGRPHWLVFDEAHHFFPAERGGDALLSALSSGTLYVTVNAGQLSPAVRENVERCILMPPPFVPVEPETPRERHRRKYAKGELRDKSFVFTGPHDRMQLRAKNLQTFVELARGLDDETWTYHLRNGDYARWFGETLGDDELACVAASAERASSGDSRSTIVEAIERRYTASA